MNKFKYLFNRMAVLLLILWFFILAMTITFIVIALKTHRFFSIPIICLIFFFLISYSFYKWVYLPYKETKKVLELFISEYTMQGIYDLRYPYTSEIEAAFNKTKSMLKNEELINATKKQAQYMALQNQINPHFLYNTLEGIRSEALIHGLDSVADMTKALATFFRYTISNMEKLVTLKSELSNIENYFFIQKYRFEDRMELIIKENEDYESALTCMIPKLTLQPIVENSIIHGIERKTGKGTIIIETHITEKRLLISVSDDGVGMDKEKLKKLNQKINLMSLEYINKDHTEGGIAIVNVNNRIKLLFGEQYGIHIYSAEGLGTDVEIVIPLEPV